MPTGSDYVVRVFPLPGGDREPGERLPDREKMQPPLANPADAPSGAAVVGQQLVLPAGVGGERETARWLPARPGHQAVFGGEDGPAGCGHAFDGNVRPGPGAGAPAR